MLAFHWRHPTLSVAAVGWLLVLKPLPVIGTAFVRTLCPSRFSAETRIL
jgi:hypothetical protein